MQYNNCDPKNGYVNIGNNKNRSAKQKMQKTFTFDYMLHTSALEARAY